MHYRLLGPLEVFSDDGTQVPISGERERVLLATLLLGANRVVSSGRLIEAIWGDEEPSTATNALQVHVSKLRRKLADAASGESPLLTSSPGYVLTVAAGELDLEVFESLLEEAQDEPKQQRFGSGRLLRFGAGVHSSTLTRSCFSETGSDSMSSTQRQSSVGSMQTLPAGATSRSSLNSRACSMATPFANHSVGSSCSRCTERDARPTRLRATGT
jgi:hypothetical protein